MTKTQKVGTIIIDEDIQFQQRMWKTQYWAWGCMVAVIIAGIAGFFGPGLLSKVHATNKEIKAEYDRFIRYHSPAMLKLTVQSTAIKEDVAHITMDQTLDEAIEIKNISPSPEHTETKDDKIIYFFPLKGKQSELKIVFYYKPEKIGMIEGAVGQQEGNQIKVSQIVYP